MLFRGLITIDDINNKEKKILLVTMLSKITSKTTILAGLQDFLHRLG